jgi:hypothetical protein
MILFSIHSLPPLISRLKQKNPNCHLSDPRATTALIANPKQQIISNQTHLFLTFLIIYFKGLLRIPTQIDLTALRRRYNVVKV